MANGAAERRHRSPERSASVGVVHQRESRRADPRRRGVERAVLGVPEHGRGGAYPRVSEPESLGLKPRHAQDGDVVPRIERHRLRRELGVRAERADPRIPLAGHDVRRRDDLSGRRDPAGALDPEAARRPEHADDARRRFTDAWQAQHARIRRRHLGERPTEGGKGIEPCQRVQDRRRWQEAVQPPKDERALHLPPPVRVSGELERNDAGRPGEHQPGRRTEKEAPGRVE